MKKQFTLAFLSIIAYLFAPIQYSYSYCIICFVLFLVSSVLMIQNNCKQTFVKFEFFFIISMFFACIAYPLIHYPVNPYFSLFHLSFNEDYICKGLGLAVVGICFFNTFVYEKDIVIVDKHHIQYQSFNFPKVLFYIPMMVFIPYLYRLYQTGQYTTEFEHSLINAVLVYVIYFLLFVEFGKKEQMGNNSFRLTAFANITNGLIILYIGLFILIGSRTIPLRVILCVLFLYGIFVKHINKIALISFILVGSLLMTMVGVVRMGQSFIISDVTSAFDLGNDLTINNRSLYVLMEHVDLHGISFGKSMLMQILSAIPFAQSLFLSMTGIPDTEINSALLVTFSHFSRGDAEIIGLGTNVIGDIYLAFGLPGVIVLMSLLGYVVKRLYTNISCGSLLSVMLYMLMFMDVVYLPRSGYFTSLRPLLWCYVIYRLSLKKV